MAHNKGKFFVSWEAMRGLLNQTLLLKGTTIILPLKTLRLKTNKRLAY
jgi:hypothetical protein